MPGKARSKKAILALVEKIDHPAPERRFGRRVFETKREEGGPKIGAGHCV
jgi:hypothetical protein